MSGVIALQLQTQVADLCLLQGCSDRKCQKFYALSRLVSRLYSNVLYDTMLYTLRYDDLAYFFTLCSTVLLYSLDRRSLKLSLPRPEFKHALGGAYIADGQGKAGFQGLRASRRFRASGL